MRIEGDDTVPAEGNDVNNQTKSSKGIIAVLLLCSVVILSMLGFFFYQSKKDVQVASEPERIPSQETVEAMPLTKVPPLVEDVSLEDKEVEVVASQVEEPLAPEPIESPEPIEPVVTKPYQVGETEVNGIGMTFVYLKGGYFDMGSLNDELNRDADEVRHRVELSTPFFMSQTEVTQAQWEQVMGRLAFSNDVEPEWIGDALPMHSVTWHEAVAFCRALSAMEGAHYRLPTEAEWEYACAAGTESSFNLGEDYLTSDQANIYDPNGDSYDSPTRVKTAGPPNSWGLYDMHGNVWEWCSDWSAPYQVKAQTDPSGISNRKIERVDLAMKAVRGGSYYDSAAKARTRNRWEYAPSVSTPYIGFRVVKEFLYDNKKTKLAND